MNTLWQDVRYSLRMLRKKPGFTFIAVLVLALGVGANTAIFSVVNAVLLRPLPLKDAERIVVPVSTNQERGYDNTSVSYGDFLDWRDEQVFAEVAVFQERNYDLTQVGEPERVRAIVASGDFFSIMGVRPTLGRWLQPEDNQASGENVAVISDGLWRRRFGADEKILGKTITLGGKAYSVVGVMPTLGLTAEPTEVWTPLRFEKGAPDQDILRRDNFIWQAIARLKSGVTLAQTDQHLIAIARRIEQENYASRKGWSARAVPLQEYLIGSQLRIALLILLGAVGFVLLIACVNVANLLLTRAAAREKEMAIRMALGAGRLRLIRQLLSESLLLGLIGGVVGLLLALWGIDVLVMLAPTDIPRLHEAGIDARVLSFALVISVATAILFGLIPAFHVSKTDLNESLKEGGRASVGGRRGGRARSLLVVSEIALSLVLLISAGLMIKSFLRLQQVAPGFSVDNLLTMEINLPKTRYRDERQVSEALQGILERLRTLPNVQAASAESALPLGGGGFYLGRVFLEEGKPEPPSGSDFGAHWNVITPDYFATLKIPVLKGRVFTAHDDEKSAPVIIINETMARQMFSGQDAIGKRIRSWRDENELREIVGVVRDVRFLGRDDAARGLVYVPHRQDVWRSMVISVRTNEDPIRLTSDLRNVIWAADKDLALANITTMQQILLDSTARPRFSMLLLSVFALVAMVLATVGVYGVMSYTVAQRTHEIGIRMAIGARAGDVLKLILFKGLKLTIVGVGLGLLGALALTRLMSSLLFEVSATDPVIFLVISLILTATAFIACFIPAHRATRVDPMIMLRYE